MRVTLASFALAGSVASAMPLLNLGGAPLVNANANIDLGVAQVKVPKLTVGGDSLVHADVDANVANVIKVDACIDVLTKKPLNKSGCPGYIAPSQPRPDTDCAPGYTRDWNTKQCERTPVSIPVRTDCVRPNDQGNCPVDWQRHPTLLDLCISANFDIYADLSISGPHRGWSDYNTRSCGEGWNAHHSLLGVCIDARIRYNLDLGLHGRRPDWHNNCPTGWRKHNSILNLCLDASLDLDIADGHLGRRFDDDNRCTAGWNRHPHVLDLCVDAALDLSLFNQQRPTNKDGSCDAEYKRHASILDLCLWVGVDADVKVLAPVVKSGNTNNSVVKAAVDVAAKADVGAKAAGDVAAGLKAKVGTVLDANVNAVLGAKIL